MLGGGKYQMLVLRRHPGELIGEASAVTVGATNNGEGLIASIDDVVVRVPSPF